MLPVKPSSTKERETDTELFLRLSYFCCAQNADTPPNINFRLTSNTDNEA
jgi:hypothetical protein